MRLAALAGWAVLAAAPAARADGFARYLCTINSDPEPALGVGDPGPAARFGGALKVTGREVALAVAFTFDDGPSEATTPAVLDALAAYDVPAAFFVVGARVSGARVAARANAELLRRVAAAGYPIGNHTQHHRDVRSLAAAAARLEIGEDERAIARVTGIRPYLFRPPYGHIGGAARAFLRAHGYTEVRWSIDSEDYLPCARRARCPGGGRGFNEYRSASLRARVLAAILQRGGGVVLMHDTKPWTAAILPGILDDLEAENCRRLDAGEPPIVPVPLDYFLRDRGGRARALPAAVAAHTERWRAALPARCRARIDKGKHTI